jgi:threonine dehydratase
MTVALPTYDDVVAAAARIAGHAHRTPVLTSRTADAETGARLFFKCENLQKMGAFKFRGAFNALSRFDERQRRSGVVAFSSGNHAQAVALAARWLGTQATIVMPSDAPRAKLQGTRAHGAEIVLYDREHDDRELIATRLAAERGAALVPPFDHTHVIAGQGSAALELGRAVRERRCELDALYVPCGGGGLAAGSALAIKSVFPGCGVHVVEPVGYTDTGDSLEAGERRVLGSHPPTLCDGLRSPTPGALTFAINRRLLSSAHAVDDATVREAMALALEHLKVVVEPSGAVGLAALLSGPPRKGGCVGVILSGGNVDAALLSRVLADRGTE